MSIKKTIINIYLVLYNVAQFLGWSTALVFTVNQLIQEEIDFDQLWEETNYIIKIFQTLAVLEVLHALIGIVRSGVMVTAMQISSRVFVLWCICDAVPEARLSYGLPLLLIAWCVTEIIRYSFYFLNILKAVPYFLIYLRYTLFIGLYPLGVAGELLSIYDALPTIEETKLFYVELPNEINFGFDFYVFCIVIMLLYIPLFPQLYCHMFAQRKKYLGVTPKPKEN